MHYFLNTENNLNLFDPKKYLPFSMIFLIIQTEWIVLICIINYLLVFLLMEIFYTFCKTLGPRLRVGFWILIKIPFLNLVEQLFQDFTLSLFSVFF